jgi:hypothetical protein
MHKIIKSKPFKMNQNQNQNQRTPYCKVCHDAGKTAKEYTSHWVKSQDRKTGKTIVTCPTLNSLNCRYCYESGHTAKYCPALAIKEKERKRQIQPMHQQQQQQQQPVKKPIQQPVENRGGFAPLLEKEEQNCIDDDLALNCTEGLAHSSAEGLALSYAAAAAKPALIVAKPVAPSNFQVLQKGDRLEKTEVTKSKYISTCSWAALDSDSEDE